ncbi:cupin domain-containing protein [Oceanobacillus kapialis]|uniref:Cupin domain-containing protein n=1 Tax=Oceanobacillus kapialis TaxID=481353 RepID=A0ABW5Q3H9_9BACI
MQLFRFDKEVGSHVTQYNSDFWFSRILRTNHTKLQISCMTLEAGGLIGGHLAKVDQLLLILEGEGSVTGENNKMESVKRGEAVFLKTGEWHETRSENGLIAIAIEGEELDQATFMKAKGEK